MVLKDVPFTVCGLDAKEVYLTPHIGWYFLGALWATRSIDRTHSHGVLRWVLKRLACAYFLAVLRYLKPKVVTTYIDDDPLFHWLSRHFRAAEFFAIQNSARTKRDLSRGAPFDFTNLFCLGEYERDRFAEFGHRVDHCIPVGSVRADYFREAVAGIPQAIQYDIVLISQWTPAIMLGGGHPDCKRAIEQLNRFLAQYARERALTLAIALRGNRDGQERRYYESVYGAYPIFLGRDDEAMATHRAMWQSELVMAFFSTMGREALGWGKKVLYCDASGHDEYTYYQNELLVFRGDRYADFAAHLDRVRAMSGEEYRAHMHADAHYLMVCDAQQGAHQKIRQRILRCLVE